MAKAQAKGSPGPTAAVLTLKRRPEFQRIRKGARWATRAFVLEAKARGEADGGPRVQQPRFGFTVTRQIGKAVERNRIRRRLKAAVGRIQSDHAKAEFDYVVVARRPALTSPFDVLLADLVQALGRVHKVGAQERNSRNARR